MPAAPELLRVQGLVRRVKVLGQVEAHEHGNTRGNVCVAGEIGIYLQRIAEKGAQVLKAAVKEGILEHPVAEVDGKVVAENQFLAKAVQDPEHSNAKPTATQVVGLVQLLNKFRGAHDRTGHKLREERKIEAEVQEILYGSNLPPLHVHNVTHRLEGEEGNAHRQDDGIYPEHGRPAEHIQPFP